MYDYCEFSIQYREEQLPGNYELGSGKGGFYIKDKTLKNMSDFILICFITNSTYNTLKYR